MRKTDAKPCLGREKNYEKERERREGQPFLELAGPCFGAFGPGLFSEHKTNTVSTNRGVEGELRRRYVMRQED